MTPSNDDLASELAYVRALAEEGRNTPLIGGVFYLIWGGLMGLAALIVYLHVVDVVSTELAGGFAPWVTAGAIGWILSFTVGRRAGTKPGAQTLGNKTANAVWLAVGIFMTLLFIGMIVSHERHAAAYDVPSYFLFSFMFPIAFGVYGVAFFATATAARLTWLRWFACLAWGFSLICLFLLGSAHQLLVGAIGTVVCAALPGVILMTREPSEVV